MAKSSRKVKKEPASDCIKEEPTGMDNNGSTKSEHDKAKNVKEEASPGKVKMEAVLDIVKMEESTTDQVKKESATDEVKEEAVLDVVKTEEPTTDKVKEELVRDKLNVENEASEMDDGDVEGATETSPKDEEMEDEDKTPEAAKEKASKASGKKKPKIRVDVQDKILAYFGQQLQTDRKDVPKEEVAQECGFAKSGSHGFFYAWQDLLKNKGWIARSSEKGCFRLTDQGKDNIPEGVVLVSARKDNAGMLEFFKTCLLKQCKKAKSDKVDIMFDILKDGKPHSLEEFTNATGYANLKSAGLGYPFSHMEKKMKVLEKNADKMYQLTDKCFPDGRP
ncbi:expressed unknown protein [Seminavis robusta]|uniref:Uncharacterized protein n=1 Tax=Seminavis robusta TaxID=568900 RepID=A0A9N8H8E8_9STRA|nr:expressed unknown protein [Seminavis robusta]|eukprot:Sro157_g071380.1 n/a (335) ;mRNA; r:95124-96128